MLHTLNKAWVIILINQLKNGLIHNVLFVPKDIYEAYDTSIWIKNIFEEEQGYTIYTQDIIKSFMNTKNSQLPIFDDILISHDIHNSFMKDYLHKHCRRKGG